MLCLVNGRMFIDMAPFGECVGHAIYSDLHCLASNWSDGDGDGQSTTLAPNDLTISVDFPEFNQQHVSI